jgi:hypothetical protein
MLNAQQRKLLAEALAEQETSETTPGIDCAEVLVFSGIESAHQYYAGRVTGRPLTQIDLSALLNS